MVHEAGDGAQQFVLANPPGELGPVPALQSPPQAVLPAGADADTTLAQSEAKGRTGEAAMQSSRGRAYDAKLSPSLQLMHGRKMGQSHEHAELHGCSPLLSLHVAIRNKAVLLQAMFRGEFAQCKSPFDGQQAQEILSSG